MKRTEELTDDDLDYYVAIALGAKDTASPDENAAVTGLMFHWRMWTGMPRGGVFVLVNRASLSEPWRPSRNWAQAGWLVERFNIGVERTDLGNCWGAWIIGCAQVRDDPDARGTTPTEAIARAVVASVYGTAVPA